MKAYHDRVQGADQIRIRKAAHPGFLVPTERMEISRFKSCMTIESRDDNFFFPTTTL
jgi:hypothetical protein